MFYTVIVLDTSESGACHETCQVRMPSQSWDEEVIMFVTCLALTLAICRCGSPPHPPLLISSGLQCALGGVPANQQELHNRQVTMCEKYPIKAIATRDAEILRANQEAAEALATRLPYMPYAARFHQHEVQFPQPAAPASQHQPRVPVAVQHENTPHPRAGQPLMVPDGHQSGGAACEPNNKRKLITTEDAAEAAEHQQMSAHQQARERAAAAAERRLRAHASSQAPAAGNTMDDGVIDLTGED